MPLASSLSIENSDAIVEITKSSDRSTQKDPSLLRLIAKSLVLKLRRYHPMKIGQISSANLFAKKINLINELTPHRHGHGKARTVRTDELVWKILQSLLERRSEAGGT